MAEGIETLAVVAAIAVAFGFAGIAVGLAAVAAAAINLVRAMRAASYRRPHPSQPWAADRELGDFDMVLTARAAPRAEPEVQRLRDGAAL